MHTREGVRTPPLTRRPSPLRYRTALRWLELRGRCTVTTWKRLGGASGPPKLSWTENSPRSLLQTIRDAVGIPEGPGNYFAAVNWLGRQRFVFSREFGVRNSTQNAFTWTHKDGMPLLEAIETAMRKERERVLHTSESRRRNPGETLDSGDGTHVIATGRVPKETGASQT